MISRSTVSRSLWPFLDLLFSDLFRAVLPLENRGTTARCNPDLIWPERYYRCPQRYYRSGGSKNPVLHAALFFYFRSSCGSKILLPQRMRYYRIRMRYYRLHCGTNFLVPPLLAEVNFYYRSVCGTTASVMRYYRLPCGTNFLLPHRVSSTIACIIFSS